MPHNRHERATGTQPLCAPATLLCGSHARVRSQQSRQAALRAARSVLLAHRRAGEREKHAAHLLYVTVLCGSHARARSQHSREAALRAAIPDSANAQTRGKPDGFPRVCLSQHRPESAREPALAPSARHPRSSSTPALRWRRLPAPPCIGALHPTARVMPRAALPPRCTASPAERALPDRAQSLECGLAHSAAM